MYYPRTSFITNRRRISSLILLVISFLSCSESSTTASTELQGPPPPPPFVLNGSAEQIPLSNELVSFGGINLLKDFIHSIDQTSQKALKAPLNIRSLWLDNFIRNELLFGPEFIFEERPFRFAQMVHNGQLETVRLIGINDLPKLRASLGSYFTSTEESGETIYIQAQYKDDKNPLYFKMIGQMLISTRAKDLLHAKYTPFYTALIHAKFDGFLSIHSYPERALALWGGDLVSEGNRELTQLELVGSDASQTRQRAVLSTALTFAQSAAKQADRVTFTLNDQGDRISLSLKWKVKKGSHSAQQLATLSVPPRTLLKQLPTSTPLLASISLKPEVLQNVLMSLNQVLLSRGLLSEHKQILENYLSDLKTLSNQLSGELLLAGIVPPSAQAKPRPSNVEDDEEERELEGIVEAEQIFMPKKKRTLEWIGMISIMDQMLTRSGLKQLLSYYSNPEFSKVLRAQGLVARVKEIKKADQSTVTQLSARMPRVPRVLRPIRTQLKDLYSAKIDIQDKQVVSLFGDRWEKTLSEVRQLNEKHRFSSTKAYKNLKNKTNVPFFYFYLDPIALINALKSEPAGSLLLPLQAMFSPITIEEGLSIHLSTAQDTLNAELSLPYALLSGIRQGMSGVTP